MAFIVNESITFNMIDLPYLSSERHFRRYEPYITEIVSKWPQPVAFDLAPPITSVETLASRIRICVKAFQDNLASGDPTWQVKFPVTKFVQIADEITVSVSALPGKVLCGPYDAVRKRTPLGVKVAPEITQVVPKVRLVNPNHDLLRSIIILHHYKLLTEPSIVECDPKFDMAAFTADYDVAFEQNGTCFTIV